MHAYNLCVNIIVHKLKNKIILVLIDEQFIIIFIHTLHLIVLLCIGLLYTHVQIITRLLFSSSPIIYLALGQMVSQQDQGQRDQGSSEKNMRLWILSYCFLFYIMGIMLHTNYYPWT